MADTKNLINAVALMILQLLNLWSIEQIALQAIKSEDTKRLTWATVSILTRGADTEEMFSQKSWAKRVASSNAIYLIERVKKQRKIRKKVKSKKGS